MEKANKWILIIFSFVSLVHFCLGIYSIQVPKLHIAFSNNNVTVNYTLSEEQLSMIVLELIDIDTNRSVNRNQVFSPPTVGSLVYLCGMFTNESKMMFLLLDDNETVLAESDILSIEQPSIDVVWPSPQIYTLSGSVQVFIYMDLDNGLCSDNECELKFIARYRRYNDKGSTQFEIYSKTIKYQRELNIEVNCEYLDTGGFYNFLVITKIGRILGESNFRKVDWNTAYSINAQSPSISEIPENGLFIQYNAPRSCDKGTINDKIRIYAQVSGYSAEPGPIGSMIYLFEEDTSLEHLNIISRSIFDKFKDDMYHGYCFYYVSVTRIGSVHEQAHSCIPNLSSDIAIAGGWTEWGEWSDCTATCGEGSRHRTRACENPPPSNGGLTCVGDYVKTGTCNSSPCPTGTTGEHLVVIEQPKKTCECRCIVEDSTGLIDAYDKSCHSQATWLIRVHNGNRINLTFKSFDLSNTLYQEYLRVRDGPDSDAPILLFATGTRLPIPVASSRETMFLEYKIYRSNNYRHGFSASFNSTVKEYVTDTTKKLPMPVNPHHNQFSGNIIMLAGVATCVGVILITITAVTYIYIKSGLMLDFIRKIKPRIKSEFAIPAEQDTCSPVHRPYKRDLPSDMDDRGNPDGKVCDRSQMYLAKEDQSNVDSNDFPGRLISIDSDDSRKPPLGQDQSFTGTTNPLFDDRFPDGPKNHRYSFHSDGSRSSRFTDLQIKFTVREGPSGFSRQASINSCDSSNTLPPNFQFSAPYVNRDGNLTPLGFAISRSLSLCNEKDNRLGENAQRSQSTCGISGMPETHLIDGKRADKQTTPTSIQAVVHSEIPECDSRSPTNRVPRKLPVTPRPAFYEFQQPDQNSPQRSVTPTRQKHQKNRRLSTNKNAVMTINEEPYESTDKLDYMSPSESVYSHISLTRESPPGGPVRRLKQKAAKRQRKSTECLSSAESDMNCMRMSVYSTSSQDLFSDDQPSPIRKYEKIDDKRMWRQVFLSDESLSKTISGNEDRSADSSPTRRRLPETPTKRPNSFNNNQLPSINAQVCDDMIIYQEENELEFDNYMPNIPGSYFEGDFNYPGGLGQDMDLFEGLEISKV